MSESAREPGTRALACIFVSARADELKHGIATSSHICLRKSALEKALAPHHSRGAADAVGVAAVGPEEATSWGNLRGTRLALVLLQSVRARAGAPAGTISRGHHLG